MLPRDRQATGQSQALLGIKAKAEQGNADAQTDLGVIYARGKGVSKDLAKAVEWTTRAAEQGEAQAQYNLGVFHTRGEGVPVNVAKAVEWYSRAAEQGHADAQCELGNRHFQGYGVPKDLDKAAEWYRKAGEQGHVPAQRYLENLIIQARTPVFEDHYELGTWADFVSDFRGHRVGLAVRDTKAVAMAGDGLIGKGPEWTIIVLSWVNLGLFLSAIPFWIWLRWYWGAAAVVFGIVLWRGVKVYATRRLVMRCLENEAFFLHCYRLGYLSIRRRM